MARKFEKSIKDKQIPEVAKEAMRNKQRRFREGIRQKLATDPTLTLDQKVELIIDFIVGGE